MTDGDNTTGTVQTTVELVGDYEEIAEILGKSGSNAVEVEPVASDLVAILEIVSQTDGATKSQIAEEATGNATADFDGESVIHALRLLSLYDLVTLDGNTWRPGPALNVE